MEFTSGKTRFHLRDFHLPPLTFYPPSRMYERKYWRYKITSVWFRVKPELSQLFLSIFKRILSCTFILYETSKSLDLRNRNIRYKRVSFTECYWKLKSGWFHSFKGSQSDKTFSCARRLRTWSFYVMKRELEKYKFSATHGSNDAAVGTGVQTASK